MILLDGKRLADQILADLKTKLDPKNPPHLDIIIVGDNPASATYVKLKSKACQDIGIKTTLHRLGSATSTPQVIDLISKLNSSNTTGIMVQLPLPDHLDKYLVLNTIDPKKDIDGLTNTSLGLLFQGVETGFISASPLAVITLLDHYKIKYQGKHVVIVNNTPLVGLPLAALFNNRQATVTLCHKYTQDIKKITFSADILISAVGIKNFITADMIKNNTVVIGLGVCRDESGKMAGDLDFGHLSTLASHLTPNFGGIGPMTVACLLKNVITSHLNGLSKNPTL